MIARIVGLIVGGQAQFASFIVWLSALKVAQWIGTKLLFFFLFTVVLPIVLTSVAGAISGNALSAALSVLGAQPMVLEVAGVGAWMLDQMDIVNTFVTVLTVGFTAKLINRASIIRTN